MKLSKILSVLVASVVMSVSFVFAPLSAQAQTLPPYNTVVVVSQGEFSGMELEDMFDFVTNMENDELWWDGVVSTELVAGTLDGPFAGRKYLQEGSFNGFPYTTEINITGGYENVYMSLEGASPFLSYESAYVFYEKSNGNVVLTSISQVEGYGVTPELMDGAIHQAFTSLASYHNIQLVDYDNLVGEYVE